MIFANLFLEVARYLRDIKFATFLLFLLSFLNAQAQYVFLQSDAPFRIENASKNNAFTSVWIKLVDPATPVGIVLADGRKLNRSFKKIEHPYYVIENGKVRYRPNMVISRADTVQLDAPTSTLKTTPETPAPAVNIENAQTDIEILTQQICALAYEWEKTERIKEVLITQNIDCSQIAALLGCLSYDASRVEIINKHVENVACLPLLENLVAEPFKSQLIKR